MAIHQLLTIGDSRPAGAELENANDSFPFQIAKQLGIRCINLSQWSTSADHALYTLLKFNADKESWNHTLVLFCLSGISRFMIIKDHIRECLYPFSNDAESMAYYKYIHSNELDEFNRTKNILAAQAFCHSKGSQILFVSNWDTLPENPVVDRDLFYSKTLAEILGIKQKLDHVLHVNSILANQYIYPNACHPNVKGHNKIAQELSDWIKEKINDQPIS